MSHTESMMRTHPIHARSDHGELTAAVDAAIDCAVTCTACADACLAEGSVDTLRRCIRTDQDCADVCIAVARLLSRQTEPEGEILRAQVEACRIACRACGEECAKHAGHHEHCRICAEACRECEEACARLLKSLPAGAAHLLVGTGSQGA